MIPVIVVAGVEVTITLGATLVCDVKLNGVGVVTGGIVVTVKVAATPPTVTVAEVAVPSAADDNTLTARV